MTLIGSTAPSWRRAPELGKSFCVGRCDAPASRMSDSLAAYPHWPAVACAAVAAAAAVWLLVRLLKAALRMLFFAILVVAAAAAVWLFLTQG